MKTDETFKNNYSFHILEEVKPGFDIYYYPEASKFGGQDGIIVQIESNEGNQWIGVFAFGKLIKEGFSGFYTTPHLNKLCIVSNGAGYLISSNNPKDWKQIESTPIRDVRTSLQHGILIFADYTKLIAYDEKGIKWQTKQLSWDNLKIVGISEKYIKGEYYDIRSEKNEFFEVDLYSGKSIGGI